ncbi:UDP-glucose 4-epimerase GalE [Dyella jiangningensis]|uniref:UDP-glucose 4-epimerase GalE n=1 Tax=Dyella jiangningensis TaxID=1379159 RepID=UPI002410A3E9|nr:UDP-glucose 4-epimerase GalE [Dyella jiangningensis]MDG2538937.1 UDP-glucose 4-epimerase GalE [Dyella jiangningensis]
MRVLVCGGAGFIGSHACVALIAQGHEVVIYDNLSHGTTSAVDHISQLSGVDVRFVQGDIRDRTALEAVLSMGFDAVIHFAALKIMSESCRFPLLYFDNNVAGTIALLQAMQATGVQRLVFSSSAAVYGDPDAVPIKEDAPLRACNPYSHSKLVMERLIEEVCEARPSFSAAILRYFNPAGAHPSGLMGEDPCGVPTNLMPYVSQVAAGLQDRLHVFGDDYPTRDGTGVRDYIHVMDLADAHTKALELLRQGGCHVLNLGTGRGYSVLEVVSAFEQVSGCRIPFEIVERRPGDVAEVWADPSRAEQTLGWHAQYDLVRMCADAWRWQSMHPNGYQSAQVIELRPAAPSGGLH